MKQKLLLFITAVLLSSANVFAESDRFTWGYWALERGSFDDAVYHFKIGADAGYWDCQEALAQMYILGIGTAKNPGKALSLNKKMYPQESEEEYNNRFWFLFYMGARLSSFWDDREGYYYVPKGFYKIPKISDAYENGAYTCKSFGVSPNISQAVKYLKKLNRAASLLDCSSMDTDREKMEEDVFNRLFAYSKTVKDEELNEILYLSNKVANEYYGRKFLEEDSINYAKTVKDIEPLKAFAKNARTTVWANKAKETYFAVVYNKFLTLLENKERLLAETIIQDESIGDFNYAKDILKISRKLEALNTQHDILKAIQQIEECEEKYSVLQDKLAEWGAPRNKTFLAEVKAELVETIDKQQLEASKKWNATTSISIMNDLVASVSNSEYKTLVIDAYQGILLNKADAWNATTKIAEMDAIIGAKHINKNTKDTLVAAYQKVALDKSAAWYVNTEIAEMDAVIEAKYIIDETKDKLLAAYQENALVKIGTIKKSKSMTEIDNTAFTVLSMKHIDDTTIAKVRAIRQKAANKSVSAFHIGVEGIAAIADAEINDDESLTVNAADFGGGASILLGRPSNWFNIYAGGFYTWHNGTSGKPLYGIKFRRIDIPVELRYNLIRSNSATMYLGVGASYNIVQGGTLRRYSDSDKENNFSIKLTDGLNDSYLAPRLSFGTFIPESEVCPVGFDISLYAKYNISSPFNPEGPTDKLSEYSGYVPRQLSSKFALGFKFGIFF